MPTQNTAPENIHPEFHRMLDRRAKEDLLQQKGCVIWLYGLSGSGKSTLANLLERRLHEQGQLVKLLDGDNVRSGLNNNLGFSDEDRLENVRRVAEVAKLFSTNGTITLASFITPKNELRQVARDIIGDADFNEVYVKCSFDTCAQRDVKGLYAKAKAGALKQFTGKDSSFEEPAPEQADLIIDTDTENKEKSLEKLYQWASTRVTQ